MKRNMRFKPRTVALFVAALAIVYLIGVRSRSSTSSTTTLREPQSVPSLSWTKCVGKDAPEDPYQCATIPVPVNYADPEGQTLSVALVRYPATDTKRGIILANPGGPGGSGFDYIAYQGGSMASTLQLQNYDIVGFDPRGVDRSSRIACQTDKEMDKYLYVDSTPDTAAEKALYEEAKNSFTKACKAKYGDSLAQFSTENTARDMDLIRRAMGEETLNYIGISYGTYLGGVYATLFPERVGAMYLDGAFDPAGDTVEQQFTTQAEGFENAFTNWATDCQASPTCAFHATDVAARWDALSKKLDDTPITSSTGREVNNAVMDTATTSALYAKGTWSTLSEALASAEKGRGDQLLRLADAYNERSADGTFSSLMQSFPVIRCASGMGSPAPKDPESLLKAIQQAAPRRARDTSLDDLKDRECEGLMDDPPIIELNYRGTAPIVVVGGKNDPATPFRWAKEMASKLGEARLVTYTGEGHGVLLSSKCVDAIARRLFSAKAELPKDGTICAPDPVVSRPGWWTLIPAPGPTETVIARERGDAYVGMTTTQIYAEYRAMAGSRATVSKKVAAGLRAAGFDPQESNGSDTGGGSQYFYRGNEVLGVLVISEKDLKNGGFLAPSGPAPVGTSLVVYFYFPPDA